MSDSGNIVDQNAYENSIGLASAAQKMFMDLAAKNPDKSTYNNKIDTLFTNLLRDLNNKADANTIMMDVHVKIHPGLISGYDIEPIPESPMPVLLVII
ncbi:MAG: hypothetical protein E6K98_01260, partial [Thaumarchaeota archaeon]